MILITVALLLLLPLICIYSRVWWADVLTGTAVDGSIAAFWLASATLLGRITLMSHNVYSFFPFAAEMNYLLAMHLRGGPWAGMYLAQLMSFIYMSMAVLTVASAMPNPRAAVLASVAMVAVPWTTMLASIAYNESAL